MRVLVVNPGSSSLKLGVVEPDGAVVRDCDVNCVDGQAETATLEEFLDGLPTVDAAGVRLVHGGAAFRTAVVADDHVLAGLRQVADLAPLHNPPAITALEMLRRRLPGVPVVACFDTAFHAALPAAAAVYAVPWEWTQRGVRRYGFHGLSHAYATRRAAELLGSPVERLRLVTCHLGAGASLAAVHGGVSVDTTMGFTPLDGLVMATRSGSVDPGVLIWAQRHLAIPPAELERVLDQRSGLLAVSGTSGDMRDVLDAAGRGDERAALALAVYLHRLRAAIAAMAAASGGIDALVFTGGVGENAARIRQDTCEGLRFLGITLDPGRNTASGDREVSPAGSSVRVVVVHAREDLEIARETRRLLTGDDS